MSIGIVPSDLPCLHVLYLLYYTVHLHRKYLNRKGIKLNSDEEKVQWKDVKKKMNNHIRYLRRRSKETKDSAVEVDMDI